jgi:hypothetical protein
VKPCIPAEGKARLSPFIHIQCSLRALFQRKPNLKKPLQDFNHLPKDHRYSTHFLIISGLVKLLISIQSHPLSAHVSVYSKSPGECNQFSDPPSTIRRRFPLGCFMLDPLAILGSAGEHVSLSKRDLLCLLSNHSHIDLIDQVFRFHLDLFDKGFSLLLFLQKVICDIESG